MITLLLSGRTTPSRPRAEAMAHLKGVHGPLVYDAPVDADPMPSDYVQNHALVDGPSLPPALESWRWDRDLITEIGFEDLEHLRASTRTPYYLDVLRPDESRFVDHDSVRPLVVVQADRSGERSDPAFKLFVYLKRSLAAAVFERRWAEARQAAARHCAAQAASVPIAGPGAPPAFVDGVWSLWFARREDADAFARERLEPLLNAFGDALDRTGGFVVFAEEFPVARLRRENAEAVSAPPGVRP